MTASSKYPIVVREVSSTAGSQSSTVVDQIVHIQNVTRVPQSTVSRRWFWFWLRVYVRERSQKRVNVRIPIPLPLIGALLPRQLDARRAMTLQEAMEQAKDPRRAMAEFMDSAMAFEFVRVESDDELVIVGFD